MHRLRSAYGYTDAQILYHVREYGSAWLREALYHINEDEKKHLEEEVERMRWQVHVMPLARTPWDKKGSNSLADLGKTLLKYLDNALPWIKEERDRKIRERLKNPPQERTIVN